MKKITSIALATCMVGSIFAFTACGNGNVDGVVKGDYTEVTAENQEQVMADIQAFETNVATNGGMLGDTTKADWTFGLSLAMNLDVSYDMGVEEMPNNGEFGISGNVGVNIFKDANQQLGVKGSGSIKMSTETEEFGLTGAVKTDYTSTMKMYLTDGWAYVDATQKGKMEGEEIPADEQESYMKMPVDTLLEGMGEMVPMPDLEVTSMGIADIVATLQESGLDISYELSQKSGLKIKAGIDGEMIMGLLGGLTGEVNETTLTMSMETPTPALADDCTLDLYVVINEKGILEQVSLSADVEINIPNGTENPFFIKVEGDIVLKMGNSVRVSIPDGLAENPKYQAEI